jgi:hypothetical protein
MSFCFRGVTMKMILTCCSHTILQKSAMVLRKGPWLQIKSGSVQPPEKQTADLMNGYMDRQSTYRDITSVDIASLYSGNLKSQGLLLINVIRKWEALPNMGEM